MIFLLLRSGCAQAQSDLPNEPPVVSEPNTPTPEPPKLEHEPIPPVDPPTVTPLLNDYLSELDILDSPIRQYGESASHIQMEEDLMVHILYSEGDLAALDQAVEAWVSDTVSYYAAEAVGSSSDGDSAKLLVDYCSYLIAEKYVSVKFTGIFDRPYK